MAFSWTNGKGKNNLPRCLDSAGALLAEGCTLGPPLSSIIRIDALARFEGGGGRAGYFWGAVLAAAFAAEEVVLEALEPIVARLQFRDKLE